MTTNEHKKWSEAVLSVLSGTTTTTTTTTNKGDNDTDTAAVGTGSTNSVKVKKLRKLVLLTLQLDETDKAARKVFKRTIQALEDSGGVKLDADGNVTWIKATTTKKKKRKHDTDVASHKAKRKEQARDQHQVEAATATATAVGSTGDETNETKRHNDDDVDDDNDHDQVTADGNDSLNKNEPCRGNPQGVTRLFMGNLPFAVDETILEEFIPGLTHVKWITDKETGKFYGSAFVEMQHATAAARAVAKAGTELMGRNAKINFAPALPGDVWPPDKRVVTGGKTSSSTNSTSTKATTTPRTATAGGVGIQAMSAKPDNCVKLFMGNLSYDIDDDGITKFFASVDAEVKAVRWIHHKDTGDFKGVGFVEFWNTESCDRAAALNGKNLLGRPIRIDWTD